jgi:hypothetical protein
MCVDLAQAPASAVVPLGRYGHTAVVHENKMNVLGGASERYDHFESWWQYDLVAKIWTLVTGTDAGSVNGRYSHSVAKVKDFMFMFGGQGGGVYSDDFLAFPLYSGLSEV